MFRLPEKQWPNTKLLRTIPRTTCWRYIFISQGLLWLYPCLLANCPPFPRLFSQISQKGFLVSPCFRNNKMAQNEQNAEHFHQKSVNPQLVTGILLPSATCFFFGGFVIHDMPWEPLQSVYKSLILMTIPQEFGNLHQVLTMAHLSF